MSGTEPIALPTFPVSPETSAKITFSLKYIWNKLRRQRAKIAIFGLGGSGKTVLFDHLCGKGFKPEYKTPDLSIRIEKDNAIIGKKSASFIVFPGQKTNIDRKKSIAATLRGQRKFKFDGFIHIVSGGFNNREKAVEKDIIERTSMSLEDYITSELTEEVNAIHETLEIISMCRQESNNPGWLLIIINKCDLFQDKIEEYEKYYQRDPSSPFVKAVREHLNFIGRNNLRVEFCVASCWPEDFIWGHERKDRQIDGAGRYKYFTNVVHKIKILTDTR